jgi:hypothetical protein
MSQKIRVTAQDILRLLEDKLCALDMYPGTKAFDEGYRNAVQTTIDEINGMREGKPQYVRLLRRRPAIPS